MRCHWLVASQEWCVLSLHQRLLITADNCTMLVSSSRAFDNCPLPYPPPSPPAAEPIRCIQEKKPPPTCDSTAAAMHWSTLTLFFSAQLLHTHPPSSHPHTHIPTSSRTPMHTPIHTYTHPIAYL
jgi:hypothetical protein